MTRPSDVSPLYPWEPGPFPARQTTVYERDRRDERPVLYDAKGQPLVRRREPLGFQPPSHRAPRVDSP